MLRFLLMTILAVFTSAVNADEPAGPERWNDEIASLEAKWQSAPAERGGVLFIGSSSIRLWDLKKSFPDLVATNHGFGGSQLSDSVHFIDRLAVPVQPKVIVVYAGDNDLASGKTPETIANDFVEFTKLVTTRLPDCQRVVFIAIKPSVKRWNLADQQRDANSRIQNLCEATPERLRFLDVWPPMLNEQQMPRPELLVEDGLHLNEAGYKIWADLLRPHLMVDAERKRR